MKGTMQRYISVIDRLFPSDEYKDKCLKNDFIELEIKKQQELSSVNKKQKS